MRSICKMTNIVIMRHHSRMEFFVHRCGEFYPKGSTMVMWPLLIFGKHRVIDTAETKQRRSKLAALLLEVRRDPAKLKEFRSMCPF